MPARCPASVLAAITAALVSGLVSSGCSNQQLLREARDSTLARELDKASLPAYVIEPPDILTVDALRIVPTPPYRIEPLDALIIAVEGLPPEFPIQGVFAVDPDGTVILGVRYGSVRLVGMTLQEARTTVENHLKDLGVKTPQALVALYQSRAQQQIRGEHLVRPDGSISLGNYGSVYVTGMTIPEAKAAIEQHLSQYLVQPEVAVDVLAYNSKVFYIVTDGAGYGQQVIRLPVTGNETVLDAVSQVNGLAAQASKNHIWVARPVPAHHCGDQILPVDWNSIVECGRTETNYQLLPGDRIYVKADALLTFDNWVNKVAAPIERVLGVSLLGASTVGEYEAIHKGNGTGTGTGNGLGGF
jgi:polysaccharide biosynthesis/export protein